MDRTLPPGTSWDNPLPPSSPSESEELLPTLPLLLRRRRSDPSPGTLLSRAPTFPRSPARTVPRGGCVGCVLPQSPPGSRHADDALLNMTASVASRAWLLCLVDVRRLYFLNHGSKRVRSPRSADANFSRFHSAVLRVQ